MENVICILVNEFLAKDKLQCGSKRERAARRRGRGGFNWLPHVERAALAPPPARALSPLATFDLI